MENFPSSLILLGQIPDPSESTATNGLVDSDASACFEQTEWPSSGQMILLLQMEKLCHRGGACFAHSVTESV